MTPPEEGKGRDRILAKTVVEQKRRDEIETGQFRAGMQQLENQVREVDRDNAGRSRRGRTDVGLTWRQENRTKAVKQEVEVDEGQAKRGWQRCRRSCMKNDPDDEQDRNAQTEQTPVV